MGQGGQAEEDEGHTADEGHRACQEALMMSCDDDESRYSYQSSHLVVWQGLIGTVT